MDASLHEILMELSGSLPGCLHSSVIDRETGLSLTTISSGDPLDGAGADAYHNDLYRLTEVALSGGELGGPEGMVLTSAEARYVSIPLEGTNFLWLLVTRRETTVGFTQAIMRKHGPRVTESLKALLH